VSVLRFPSYPMPLGSLRIVEEEVLWITEDHGISGWFEIVGDFLSATRVSLEFVEFRECSVVVSLTERYTS